MWHKTYRKTSFRQQDRSIILEERFYLNCKSLFWDPKGEIVKLINHNHILMNYIFLLFRTMVTIINTDFAILIFWEV